MAIFAKYEGIDGESKDANHDKWVDVMSLDWGAHKPGGGATGQSRRRGAAIVDDFVLHFAYEKASPKLLEKCLRGEVVPQLDVEVTATYGGSRVTYLRYKLSNVMVTSYQVNASGNDEAGPPTVVVGNNFEEIKVTYTEFNEEGSPLGNVETVYEVESGESGSTKSKKKKKKKKK